MILDVRQTSFARNGCGDVGEASCGSARGRWRAARRLNQASPTPPPVACLDASDGYMGRPLDLISRGAKDFFLNSGFFGSSLRPCRSRRRRRRCSAGSSTMPSPRSWLLPAHEPGTPATGTTTQAMSPVGGGWSSGESKCAELS